MLFNKILFFLIKTYWHTLITEFNIPWPPTQVKAYKLVSISGQQRQYSPLSNICSTKQHTYCMPGQEVWAPPFLSAKLPQIIKVVCASWQRKFLAMEIKLFKVVTLWHCVISLGPGSYIWGCQSIASIVNKLSFPCLADLQWVNRFKIPERKRHNNTL